MSLYFGDYYPQYGDIRSIIQIIMESFAEKLKNIRVSMGYSCNDLSKIIQESSGVEINYKTISKYENGQREPSLANLKLLANALKISTDELLGNSPVKENKIDKLKKIERELFLFRNELEKS